MRDIKKLEKYVKHEEGKLKTRAGQSVDRELLRKAKNRVEQVKNRQTYQRTDRLMHVNTLSAEYFYRSPEWKSLRYRVLKEQGNRCMLCGDAPTNGAVIQVDHIKPRSLYPELALDYNNLQVLCKACNEGKSNKDSTDWRDNGNVVILRKKKA